VTTTTAVRSALAPEDITAASLRQAGVLLVQLEIPLHTVQAAVRAPDTLVVLNPAPAASLRPKVLDFVDILVPNRSELGGLASAVPPVTPTGWSG
jgi:ribokinase